MRPLAHRAMLGNAMAKQRMSNADAAWLHMDRPTNLMVVNAVLWTDAPVDIERIRAIVRERLIDRFPRFSRRIVEPWSGIGVPSWEDDPHFDLDAHLHHIALPAPSGKAELERLVGDLMTMPLDRTKPLWHLYQIDGYGSGSAIVTRMHHCIADGIALARVLLSLTDTAPDAMFAPSAAEDGERDRLAAARTSARTAERVLRGSVAAFGDPGRGLREAVAHARALGKLLLTPPDRDSALRGELGVARRVTWSDPMPLERVKRAGRRTDTTINDILLAGMTGALHQYLHRRGTPVTQIRAMVPFNLRPLDQPLPRDLGNRFGLVYLSLPVGIADRQERLAEVHRRMAAIKDSPEPTMAYAILGLIGMTPPPVEQRLIGVFAPKTTAVMTNVPGPREPVYFAGTRVRGVIGWVPAAGDIGIGVSIFSYAGEVTVGLSTDAGLIPDPETIVAAFAAEMRALAPAPRRPRPAKATTGR